VLQPDHAEAFEEPERRFLRDPAADVLEVAAVLERRMTWHAQRLKALAAAVMEEA
jgi:hypothetical protein